MRVSLIPHSLPPGLGRRLGETAARTRLSPNALTCIGLVGHGGAAALAAYGHFWQAGLVLVFASAFDLLDGAVARATARATRGGAILDAVADRVAEFAMLLGLLVWFSALNHFDRETIILLGVVLAGSMLVPYTRSKAAEFGVPLPHQGLGTRDSRVVILSIGLFANEITAVLWILAVFTNLTALQRLAQALWAVRHDDGSERESGNAEESEIDRP